jgi:hypothetical protein
MSPAHFWDLPLRNVLEPTTEKAADFPILFIPIAMVITLKQWNFMPKLSGNHKVSLAIWVVDMITSKSPPCANLTPPFISSAEILSSFTGLALNGYQPEEVRHATAATTGMTLNLKQEIRDERLLKQTAAGKRARKLV